MGHCVISRVCVWGTPLCPVCACGALHDILCACAHARVPRSFPGPGIQGLPPWEAAALPKAEAASGDLQGSDVAAGSGVAVKVEGGGAAGAMAADGMKMEEQADPGWVGWWGRVLLCILWGVAAALPVGRGHNCRFNPFASRGAISRTRPWPCAPSASPSRLPCTCMQVALSRTHLHTRAISRKLAMLMQSHAHLQ